MFPSARTKRKGEEQHVTWENCLCGGGLCTKSNIDDQQAENLCSNTNTSVTCFNRMLKQRQTASIFSPVQPEGETQRRHTCDTAVLLLT